jgi:predicted DNA-binding ribbon-helix-helix protein
MAEQYSVRVGTTQALINLEPLIWQWVRDIAANRGIPLSHLMEEIDRDYRLTTDRHGKRKLITLSSAVRVFVTEHIASRIANRAPRAHKQPQRKPSR